MFKNLAVWCVLAFLALGCKLPVDVVEDPIETLIEVEFDASKDLHAGWLDRITMTPDRRLFFQRVKGTPSIFRSREADESEFVHIRNFLSRFQGLKDSYLKPESYENRIYRITVVQDQIIKVVRCDPSIYDYQTWQEPDYRLLRGIVGAFSNIRDSFIGEARYDEILQFNFAPTKFIYDLDEPLELVYSVTNLTHTDVYLNFGNQQQLGVKIYKGVEIVYDAPQVFLPATSSWKIPAGKTVRKAMVWRQDVEDTLGFGGKMAKAGTYTIAQYLLDANSPYRFTKIVITENGQGLSPRVYYIYTWQTVPATFIYELNNRISVPRHFVFPSARKVGLRILRSDGSVVYSDTTATGSPTQMTIAPFGDFTETIRWDGKDQSGRPVPSAQYTVVMWLLGQTPSYEATARYHVWR